MPISISKVEIQNPKNTSEYIPLSSDDVAAIEAQAQMHKNIAILQDYKLESASSLSSFLKLDDVEPTSQPATTAAADVASSLVFCFDLETGIALLVSDYNKAPIITTPFRYQETAKKGTWLPFQRRRPQSYALGKRVIDLVTSLQKDKSKDHDFREEDQSHCHRCAQKFGFFRWRNRCTGCERQYCSSCSSEGNGRDKGILCYHCNVFYEHRDHPMSIEGSRLAAQGMNLSISAFESLKLSDEIRGSSSRNRNGDTDWMIEKNRVECFAERSLGDHEVVYLLPFIINVARLEEDERNAATVCHEYEDLFSNILKNEMWINDVKSLSPSLSPSDRVVALKKRAIASAQEAGILLGQEPMTSRNMPACTAAMFLISYQELVHDAAHVQSFLFTRIQQGLQRAASTLSAVDFANEKAGTKVSQSDQTTRKQASVFEMIELLKFLKNLYYDNNSNTDENNNSNNSKQTTSKGFDTVVSRICQKLQSLAGGFGEKQTTSTSLDSSDYLSVDSWQRELARSFPKLNEAINSVVGIFLYSLEDLPLYRMLNEALRVQSNSKSASSISFDHLRRSSDKKGKQLTDVAEFMSDGFIKNIIEPLRVIIENFLHKMPVHPRIVFRGQSYRVAESLDDDADSFSLLHNKTDNKKKQQQSKSGGGSAVTFSKRNVTTLQQFTSTTTLFDVAHDIFLQGNRAGSFLIYVAYESIAIGHFSSFAAESEVLLPVGSRFEVVHRVPLSHLAIMDQRFDVICLQDVSADQGFGSHRMSSSQRLSLALEAQRAVSNAYREIQKFFIAPKMTEILERPMRHQVPRTFTLTEAVDQLLLSSSSSSSVDQKPNHNRSNNNVNRSLFVQSVAGSGKSSLSIFVSSLVNESLLHGFHALLISLPALPNPHKILFDPEDTSIEDFLLHRFKLPSSRRFVDLLRSEKLLLILDSLDEVPLANWPKDKVLCPVLLQNQERWPNLRIIVTCRGEHIKQHNLSMDTLCANKGSVFTIEPFVSEEVDRLTNIWLPGAGEAGAQARAAVKRAYDASKTEFKTPFSLYLLIKAYGAQLMLRRGHPFPATAQELVLANERRENNKTDNRNQQEQQNESASFSVLNQRWETDRLVLNSQRREEEQESFSSTASFSSRRLQQQNEFMQNLSERAASRSVTNNNNDTQQRELSSTSTHLPWNENNNNNSETRRDLQDICDIYEEGIKALIAQNAEHLYRDVSDHNMKRIVDDVFEWSQLLAILMITDTNLSTHSDKLSQQTTTIDSAWRSSLGEEEISSVLFSDECQRWFSDDPTVLVMLAPLRLSGYSAMAPFEFRHKSIHEFLLAYAILNGNNNSRISEFARGIDDITRFPNASLFYSIMKTRETQQQPSASSSLASLLDKETTRILKLSDLVNKILTASSSSSSSNQRLCLHKLFVENDMGANMPDFASEQFSRFFSRLTHIEISCGNMIHNTMTLTLTAAMIKGIIAHSSSSSSLECIVFDHPQLGDQELTPLFSNPAAVANLRKISLSNTKVTIKSLRALLTSNPNLDLHSLDLSYCQHTSLDTILMSMGDLDRDMFTKNNKDSQNNNNNSRSKNVFENLCFFNIANTDIFSDGALYSVFDKSPNLRALNMSRAVLPSTEKKLHSATDALVKHCRDLRSVDVSFVTDRFDTNANSLVRRCSNLVRLIANNNESVLFGVQHTYAADFKSHHLTIIEACEGGVYCDDDFIDKISLFAPRLMILKASGSRITDVGIALLAQRLLPSHLRCLDISRPDRIGYNEIHDESLSSLIRAQPTLRSLSVACRRETLSNDFLFALEEATKNTKSLRHLDVGCFQGSVSDRAICAVLRQNPHLRFLDISLGGHTVSDTTIIELSNSCLDLRALIISAMQRQVTDSGVCAVAVKCKNLRKIDIGREDSITDDSFVSLSKNAKNLEELLFGGTNKYSSKRVLDVAKGCKRLRVLGSSEPGKRKQNLSEEVINAGLLLEE